MKIIKLPQYQLDYVVCLMNTGSYNKENCPKEIKDAYQRLEKYKPNTLKKAKSVVVNKIGPFLTKYKHVFVLEKVNTLCLTNWSIAGRIYVSFIQLKHSLGMK